MRHFCLLLLLLITAFCAIAGNPPKTKLLVGNYSSFTVRGPAIGLDTSHSSMPSSAYEKPPSRDCDRLVHHRVRESV